MMDDLLLSLLIADKKEMQQESTKLHDAFTKPENIPILSEIIILSSDSSQVRQYSADSLRKKYDEAKNWFELPKKTRDNLKSVILQRIIDEPSQLVKNALAELIEVIAKYELKNNNWPNLLQLIQWLMENDIRAKELHILSAMTDTSLKALVKHTRLMDQTFTNLKESTSPFTYYVIQCILHLVNNNSNVQYIILNLLNETRLRHFIKLCLSILNDNSLTEHLRINAVRFVGWIVQTEKKVAIKLKLINASMDALFILMVKRTKYDNDEVYFGRGIDNENLARCAAESLKHLMINLSKKQVISNLLLHLQSGLESIDPYKKKAAYLCIATLSESSKFVNEYSKKIWPLIDQCLNQFCQMKEQQDEPNASTKRLFYAIEKFCENLGAELQTYLPTLVHKMFELYECNTVVQKLTLSTISTAVKVVGKSLNNTFSEYITNTDIKEITEPVNETICLQYVAIASLNNLACEENMNFAPLATKSLEFGIMLLKGISNLKLEEKIHGLFVHISRSLKNETASVLPQIVEVMIERVNEILNDEEYTNRQEEALYVFDAFSDYTEEAFLPYLERCFDEVFKFLNYWSLAARGRAVHILSKYCTNFAKIETNYGKQLASKSISRFFSQLIKSITHGFSGYVAVDFLNALTKLLKKLKSDMFSETGREDAIIHSIKTIFAGEVACQNETLLDDDDFIEIYLLEPIADILFNFGNAVPLNVFIHHFGDLLPVMINKLKNTECKKERLCIIKILSRCFLVLKDELVKFVPQLIPVFLQYFDDEDHNVKCEAIFVTGELALHSQIAAYPYRREILEKFFSNLIKEQIGEIAKNIIVKNEIPTFEYLLPICVNHLVNKIPKNSKETKEFFCSILMLYRLVNASLYPHMITLTKLTNKLLYEINKNDNYCSRQFMVIFLAYIQSDFPDVFNLVYPKVPVNLAIKMANMKRP